MHHGVPHRVRDTGDSVPAAILARPEGTYPVTIAQTTERWLLRCEQVLVYAGVVAMLAMMGLTSADALSRYVLNRPLLGAYEFTEKYLMVASIFLGLSYAYRGGMFIRVTFLVDRLPAAIKLAVRLVEIAMERAAVVLAHALAAIVAIGPAVLLRRIVAPAFPAILRRALAPLPAAPLHVGMEALIAPRGSRSRNGKAQGCQDR